MKKVLIALIFVLLAAAAAFFFSKELMIRIYHQKVWCHRTNSLEKKSEAQKKFSGVELDIVYDSLSHTFDVNHPPAKSIGLSLADYLKFDKDLSTRYWLDFKNLDSSNEQSASAQLQKIVADAGIEPANIIVESPNVQNLRSFALHGFETSYYLPSLHSLGGSSIDSVVNDVTVAVKKFNPGYISSDYKDYSLMKKHFPASRKLLWWTGSKKSFWSWQRRIALYKMLNDPKVEVLLVPFSSQKGNR